jgi:hypothetical protein
MRARDGPVRLLLTSIPVFLSCSMVKIYPTAILQNLPRNKMRKRRKTEPEELLAAIVETVDDGFCPVSELAPRFPKLRHRKLVRLRGQALRRGLVLERRGPDGRAYLALTSEGWRALRSSRTFSPSTNQTRRPSG